MSSLSMIRRVTFSAALAALSVWGAQQAFAQNRVNSGSTGADGAFAPTTSQTVQVPESGVFNFTTINIPAGVTITFARNTKNTSVTMLASGDVTIAGTINLDGKPGNANSGGGLAGPGGFSGGEGGFDKSGGGNGDGPGGGGGGGGSTVTTTGGSGGGAGFAVAGNNGGGTTAGQGGPAYGSKTALPLIGGSGGGGGASAVSAFPGPGGGGGGGGAILIASSGSITFGNATSPGSISSRGGAGASVSTGGGGGSGGTIRLVANTISGSATLAVQGGVEGVGGNGRGGKGAIGFVRVEGLNVSGFTSTDTALPISFALPNPITPVNAPQLRIASIAGRPAPAMPVGSLQGPPDVVIPTTEPNPVSVGIEATNVPVGTVVKVTVTPSTGARTTVQSGALAGTDAASTATASVTLPAGLSVLTATAVIDLTTAPATQKLVMNGERVDRMEVTATYGGLSEVTYVLHSGRRITTPPSVAPR